MSVADPAPMDAFPVVLQANAVQFAPGETFGFSHVESRMVLGCRAGRGAARVDGIGHELSPGALLVLPWGHRIRYSAAQSDPFLLLGAHLVPRHAAEYVVELGIAHEPHHRHAGTWGRTDDPGLGVDGIIATTAAERPALAYLLTAIVEVFERRAPSEPTVRAFGRLLLDELGELVHPVDMDIPTDLPDGLRRVVTYAEQHLDTQHSVGSLAVVCGVSQPTLTRWFREYLGRTPLQWLSDRRLERAMALLKTTALTVGQVAEKCGYTDPYYFSRVFRTRTGQPPTEWRRQQRRL